MVFRVKPIRKIIKFSFSLFFFKLFSFKTIYTPPFYKNIFCPINPYPIYSIVLFNSSVSATKLTLLFFFLKIHFRNALRCTNVNNCSTITFLRYHQCSFCSWKYCCNMDCCHQSTNADGDKFFYRKFGTCRCNNWNVCHSISGIKTKMMKL